MDGGWVYLYWHTSLIGIMRDRRPDEQGHLPCHNTWWLRETAISCCISVLGYKWMGKQHEGENKNGFDYNYYYNIIERPRLATDLRVRIPIYADCVAPQLTVNKTNSSCPGDKPPLKLNQFWRVLCKTTQCNLDLVVSTSCRCLSWI